MEDYQVKEVDLEGFAVAMKEISKWGKVVAAMGFVL